MNRLSAAFNSDVTFGASNVRHTLLRSHQLSDVHKAFRELVFDGESIIAILLIKFLPEFTEFLTPWDHFLVAELY